jgi:hypothetical protein
MPKHTWRKRARWAWHKLNAAPSAIRIVVIAATVLAGFSVTNLVYQVVRKPTEMLFPVSGAMNKMPAETWQQYAPAIAPCPAFLTPERLPRGPEHSVVKMFFLGVTGA